MAKLSTQRPKSVPDDFVPTPHGWVHPSCIIQLAEGETVGDAHIIGADGTPREPSPCTYARYDAAGNLHEDRNVRRPDAPQQTAAVPPPTINGWTEFTSGLPGALRFLDADWAVPQWPAIATSQVIYYFPGLESSQAENTILQPVLGWFNNAWTIASWNCCLNGNEIHSAPVGVESGDQLHGYMAGTNCVGAACATWTVVTMDTTRNTSTTLVTGAYGEAMDWAFGGVLEAYGIQHCAQLPSNGGTYFLNIKAHAVATGAEVQTPWVSTIDPVWPSCGWGSGHGTQTVATTNTPTTVFRPAPPTQCGVLWAGQGLTPNQALTSCDGRFQLWMQIDGNLVLYENGRAVWYTNTSSGLGFTAVMQGDGNFVLYDIASNPLWYSSTWSYPGAYMVLQNDGNLVIYAPGGIPLWASWTFG